LLGVEFEGYYDLVSDIGLTPIAHLTEPDAAVGDLLGYYYPDLNDFENYQISYAGSFDLTNETDPIFRIDHPAYAAFSIFGVPTGDLPPGGGSVPEPGSWALMIVGFGLVGRRMRRQACSGSVA
jgi:hypothetical protein